MRRCFGWLVAHCSALCTTSLSFFASSVLRRVPVCVARCERWLFGVAASYYKIRERIYLLVRCVFPVQCGRS